MRLLNEAKRINHEAAKSTKPSLSSSSRTPIAMWRDMDLEDKRFVLFVASW